MLTMRQALAAYRRGNDAGLGYAPYTNEPGDGSIDAAAKAAQRIDGWEVVLAPANTNEVVVLRNADGELMAIGGDGVGGSAWAVDITDEVRRMTTCYVPCAASEIPDGVTFHVLRQDQGQTIEVAWGDFGRAEHGPGDPWKRIMDRSEGPTPTYYRRVPS